MKRFVMIGSLVVMGASAWSAPRTIVNVYCGTSGPGRGARGIAPALAQLSPWQPSTLRIRGDCTESVTVQGFDDLQIEGVNGATLTATTTGEDSAALAVVGSRTVRIVDMTIDGNGAENGILFERCSDCHVERTVVRNSGAVGIHAGRMSYASLSNITVTISPPGAMGVIVTDTAMVEMDHAVLTGPGPGTWSSGLSLWKHGQVMFESTTISGFWDGLTTGTQCVAEFFRSPSGGGDRTTRILDNSGPAVQVDANSTVNTSGAPVIIEGNAMGAFSVGNYSTVTLDDQVTLGSNGWPQFQCDALSQIYGATEVTGYDPNSVDCPNLH
jgi:hypothetical protein